MQAAATPLVVVGASARAFSASAARTGRQVYAADLFADLDLRACTAAAVHVPDEPGGYPQGLVAAARTFPAGGFCYVGGLENHPAVVEAIARDRPLLGSPTAAVATVRDPWSLQRLLHAAGLAVPECQQGPHGLPRDGSFLRKPLAGAGGRGIVVWDAAAPPTAAACLWQRRLTGEPWSAAYVVSAAGGELLGMSRQLIGEAWCHARGFAYCGSLDVPLAGAPRALHDQFLQLAPALAACGLRGVVGADAVVDPEGRAWVVEINPRPTASMELVERATGRSIAASHLAACCNAPPPPAPATQAARHWAKAVLFALRPLVVDAEWLDRVAAWQGQWADASGHPALADIPPPGRSIRAGGPVCTLFAAADDAAAAFARLRQRAAAVFSPPDAAG